MGLKQNVKLMSPLKALKACRIKSDMIKMNSTESWKLRLTFQNVYLAEPELKYPLTPKSASDFRVCFMLSDQSVDIALFGTHNLERIC